MYRFTWRTRYDVLPCWEHNISFKSDWTTFNYIEKYEPSAIYESNVYFSDKMFLDSELFCTTPYLIKKYLSFLCNLIYLLKKVFNKFQAHELPPYISSLKLERAAVGSSKSTKSLKSHALGAYFHFSDLIKRKFLVTASSRQFCSVAFPQLISRYITDQIENLMKLKDNWSST